MRPFAALTKTGANIPPHTWSYHLTGKRKPSGFLKGPVTYTVTSEDKQWSRTYQVSIKKGQTTMPNEIEFEFEDAYLDKDTTTGKRTGTAINSPSGQQETLDSNK